MKSSKIHLVKDELGFEVMKTMFLIVSFILASVSLLESIKIGPFHISYTILQDKRLFLLTMLVFVLPFFADSLSSISSFAWKNSSRTEVLRILCSCALMLMCVLHTVSDLYMDDALPDGYYFSIIIISFVFVLVDMARVVETFRYRVLTQKLYD